MKKKILFINIFITIMFLLTAQESDPLIEHVNKLNSRLRLTETQIVKIMDVLKKDLTIKQKNQELYKSDAVKLIQAAYERRRDTNEEIENGLNPEQKDVFKEVVKMDRFDRELFELTEGLLLSDDQAFDLEGILIKFQNEFSQFGPGMFTPGMGGEPGEGRKRSSPKVKDVNRRMKGVMERMRKKMLKKKNHAIKKILNKEQKKLFKQIEKDRENRRKTLG